MSPDLIFPEMIYHLGNKKSGGTIEYKAAMSDNQAVRWVEFGQVYHVDCSSFDPLVHTSLNNALEKVLVTFPNGVKIVSLLYVGFETLDGHVYEFVKLVFRLKKPNGDYIEYNDPNTSWGILTPGGDAVYGGSGNVAYTDITLLKQYGFKWCFNTEYWFNAVVDGVTHADGFGIACFMPTYNTKFPGSMMIWTKAATGYKVRTYDDEYTFPDQEYNKGGLYEPYLGIIRALSLCNLNTNFLDAINAAAPGQPAVTPDDLYGVDNAGYPTQENDPSGPGGGGGDYTGGDGGTGSGGSGGTEQGDSGYDAKSDPIDFPAPPTGGALSTGTIKGFVVSTGIISGLFNELWNTSLFDIDTFQKLLSEPLDALISLHCLPFIPANGTAATIKLGNYETQQSAPVITNQYSTIDCGELTVPKYWGNALDYEPYTKNIEIYLPFIGIKQLKAEDVIGFKLKIKYIVDVLTGDLTAQIKCGKSVLYKFQGNCKATIPISAKVNESLTNLIKGAGHVAVGAVAGGLAGAATGAISAAVNTSLSKSVISRSGDLSGAVGLLDDFLPYLIIHRPIQSLAENFKSFKGYPSNITATLSSLKGYTEVEYIHLKNIKATDAEIEEIEALLKEGVII